MIPQERKHIARRRFLKKKETCDSSKMCEIAENLEGSRQSGVIIFRKALEKMTTGSVTNSSYEFILLKIRAKYQQHFFTKIRVKCEQNYE